MRHSLALVTPPSAEPVSLADAKAWVRIDGTDDDATLTILIAAARAAAEQYLRRSLITQTWKQTRDLPGNRACDALGDGVYDLPISFAYGALPRALELPLGPIQSIASVATYDLANTPSTFSPSNYTLDTGGSRLVLTFGAAWPADMRCFAACDVTFVAGYGDAAANVPQPIRTGILIHVASLYEQRGQCADAMDLPPGSKQLYNAYRILGERRG